MRRRCSGVGPDLLLGERRRVAEGAVRRRRYWWAVGEKGGFSPGWRGRVRRVFVGWGCHLLPLAPTRWVSTRSPPAASEDAPEGPEMGSHAAGGEWEAGSAGSVAFATTQ